MADDTNEYNERSSLLRSVPPSISAGLANRSVGVPSTVVEPPNLYKSRWSSIRVMYLTMFLSSITFSICMSSIWPYLQVIDDTASANFLGWVVAAYSLGQLLASPLFGLWANYRSNSREPLVVSIFVNILANVMYMYIQSIHDDQKYFLLLARAFIGFGAGNVAVVRSYVSGATTIKERTAAMANMSACQALGFILGPERTLKCTIHCVSKNLLALSWFICQFASNLVIAGNMVCHKYDMFAFQTAMVPIGYPGPIHMEAFYFNMYTAPALLSAIFGTVNVLLLFLVFREHHVYDDEDINFSIQDGLTPEQGENSDLKAVKKRMTYSPDYCAVVSSIVLFFVILFIFSVYETIGTPFTMDMFDWTKSEATLYNGVMLAVGAALAISVFMVLKVVSKRINERYLLVGGFIFCLMGFITWLPWGDDFPNRSVAPINPSGNGTTFNGTTVPTAVNGTTAEPVGCPWNYAWCSYTPKIFLAQFLGGTLFIVIGYPTCNVMSYSIYSKLLGPRPQGIWMGFLTASGSLARTLGPIAVSQMYASLGPRVTFVSMSGLIVITILFCLGIFKKMVPFSFQRNLEVLD